ncbi:MAG: pentapeptide repeat-containing protein [Alphaproteobacteria bacterium]
MTKDLPKDYRDLNAPENFVQRSPEEQKLAAVYFLKAGAIGALNKRVALAREANPSFILDLSGADLTDTDLAGADLRNANLSEADLRGASLAGARLAGATMTGALTGEEDEDSFGDYEEEILDDDEEEEDEPLSREKGQTMGLSGASQGGTQSTRSMSVKKSPQKGAGDTSKTAKKATEEVELRREKKKKQQAKDDMRKRDLKKQIERKKDNAKKFQEKQKQQKKFQDKKTEQKKDFMERKRQEEKNKKK